MIPLSCFSRLRLALLGLVLGSGMLLNACGGGTSSASGAATATPEATAPPPTITPTTPAVASATAIGVATGNAVSANIGPAGGRLSSPDGTMVLTVPAGALGTDTLIGIQPFTNLAHARIGGAFRLSPEGQTFLKPVTLTFSYSDQDLVGTAAATLGAAFQTKEGFWQWIGDATVNTVARTISVNIDHFTIISAVRGAQILPGKKTVKVKETVVLTLLVCYPDLLMGSGGNLSASLGNPCDVPVITNASDWSVNGTPNGGPVFGTVRGNISSALYTAPDTAPPTPKNLVAVSAQIIPRVGAGTQLVISNITIKDDVWQGTGSTRSFLYVSRSEVKWVLEGRVNNVAVYKPTGTVEVDGLLGCTFDPPRGSINSETDGKLTIDYNAIPPTYHGFGGTLVPSTVRCPDSGGPITLRWAVFFFGFSGSTGTEDADGIVSPGGAIAGATAVDGIASTWNYTSTE